MDRRGRAAPPLPARARLGRASEWPPGTPFALFAAWARRLSRSEDGATWVTARGDTDRFTTIVGDAKVLVGAAGGSTTLRCSRDRGMTWVRPGAGWVKADSTHGVAAA